MPLHQSCLIHAFICNFSVSVEDAVSLPNRHQQLSTTSHSASERACERGQG